MHRLGLEHSPGFEYAIDEEGDVVLINEVGTIVGMPIVSTEEIGVATGELYEEEARQEGGEETE